MNVVVSKLKEVLYSVLPITLIVLILNFTLVPLERTLLIEFIIGAIIIIIGLSIFLFGVDIGITPIGNIMGSRITKTNKTSILVIAGLLLGFIISIAEPDLHILADQVELVTSGIISKLGMVTMVSIGIAIMLSYGFVRITHKIPLNKSFTFFYGGIFIFALFIRPEILAISFDASGATTGAMTVPFILALAMGISLMGKDSKSSEEDSFGLVGITSVGAIIAVIVMGLFIKNDIIPATLEHQEIAATAVGNFFLDKLSKITVEVFLALSPIFLVFIIFQKISFKLSWKAVRRILFGLLFTFVGLILFLVGVNAGFMNVGRVVGYTIASMGNKSYIIVIGFILGFVTILAEPAVYVLTHQIEDVTSGYVKRKIILFTLSIGVGFAVALSMVRIVVPGIQLWYYLLPGYLLSLIMSYYSPKLFVGIAFDSGGVASGPMTATFILAFAQGAAESIEGASVLIDGFGMIAMVALTPIIALQVLGLIFKAKTKKEGVENSEE